MLKEKREKAKNSSESKNKSGGTSGTQNSASGEATSGSVKEEKSDLDGSSTTIKKESDGRKSTTPVKSELVTTPNGASGSGGGGGSDSKKDSTELAIKSEVKQEEGASSTLDSGNLQVKEELNESDGFGQSTNVPSTNAQQQQQQQQQQTSNVNKQSNNAEYMQQHSQIFVFSTALANKGAEAVLSGQFKSIIAYHCAQPGTKKFLEKHPLKTAQFNRQNPNQFMASMAKKGPMMRGNGNLAGNPTFKSQPMNISNNNHMQQSTASFLNPSMEDILNGTGADDISAWEQQASSLGLDALTQNGDAAGNFLGDTPNLDPDSFLGNNDVSSLGDGSLTGGPNLAGGDPISPGFGHPKLQGVKVPDENLTPQQRQHREEQLATLRRIQKVFFPEHQGPPDCQMNQMAENCMKMQGQQMGGNQMNSGPMGGPPNMNSMDMNMSNCNMNAGGGPMRGPMGGNPMFRPMGPGHGGIGPNMNDPLGMHDMGGSGMGCQMPMDSPAGMGQMSGGMMMPNKPGGPGGVGGMSDWNRLPPHHPNMMDGNKMPPNLPPNFKKLGAGQGPPPPYQQTTRSASVPIATQSPNPSSPNNPTSNLSLPSPRAYNSNMSPADASRMPPQMPMKSLNPPGQSPSHDSSQLNAMNAAAALHRSLSQSNPSTPLSAHLSPSTSLKDTDNTVNNEGKEPNLMPVPSPQQIQYLNTFEGQELTIQKQPNAGVKESPPGSAEKKPPGSSGGGGGTPSYPNTPSNPGSNQNLSNLSSTNFPVPSSPSTTPSNVQATSNAANSSDSIKTNNKSMVGSSPQQQQQGMRQNSVTDSGNQQMGSDSLFASNSPNFPGQQQQQQQQQVPSLQGNPNQQKAPGNFPNDHNCPPTPQFPPCSRSDNVPLNPSSIPPVNKVSHFDPISSLAQMSQQLTSSVSMGGNGMGGMNPNQGAMMGGPGFMGNNGPGNGPDIGMGPMHGDMGMNNPGMDCGGMGQMGGPPGGMNQFNSMGPMGPRSMSPKLGGQMPPFAGQPGMPRMMRPQMSGGMYNGANVQVKASAPNTIQYLPTRPQMNAPPTQRGPPSLEFLNRFAGPMHSMPDARMQNMQYFQQQNFNQGGGGGGMDPNNDMNDMGPMNPVNPMMGAQGIMRPRPPMRMPMGGGGPPFNAPPNSNPFFGGPKMGMEGQPLPPSGPPMNPGGMGPGGFNKFGPGGPGNNAGGNPNADPNYAQQYHNFQQQLYATNTRGQLGQQSFFGGPK